MTIQLINGRKLTSERIDKKIAFKEMIRKKRRNKKSIENVAIPSQRLQGIIDRLNGKVGYGNESLF